jgi:hypothetical protein
MVLERSSFKIGKSGGHLNTFKKYIKNSNEKIKHILGPSKIF